jgi:hypothetical protein
MMVKRTGIGSPLPAWRWPMPDLVRNTVIVVLPCASPELRTMESQGGWVRYFLGTVEETGESVAVRFTSDCSTPSEAQA